jgi:quercetin dioxygenase-like cupin family protein
MQITRSSEYASVAEDWGRLLWGVSHSQGNSEKLTVGWCVLEPGKANGRHYHPNCEEVLIVIEGEIVHSWNADHACMNEGDAIVVPAGVVHNATNVGERDARLLICFSSATRETVAARES